MDDRFNTAAGWVLGAAIVALGLSSISSRWFETERPEEMGYPIEGVVEEGGEEAGPSLATLLASADALAGEKVFAKCTACHSIAQGGPNGIGPNLWGVLGKPIGKHVAGFAYSSALAEHGGEWDYEAMDAWLKSPRAFASGTKMSFAGLSSAEDRAAVILYMRENGGGPPLPEPEAEPILGEEVGVDGAAEGPGPIEGGGAESAAQAAGAMSDEQPVPGAGAAVSNDGAKPGD